MPSLICSSCLLYWHILSLTVTLRCKVCCKYIATSLALHEAGIHTPQCVNNSNDYQHGRSAHLGVKQITFTARGKRWKYI